MQQSPVTSKANLTDAKLTGCFAPNTRHSELSCRGRSPGIHTMPTMRSLSRPGRTIQAVLIRLELADRSLGEHRLILVSERQSPMFVPLLC